MVDADARTARSFQKYQPGTVAFYLQQGQHASQPNHLLILPGLSLARIRK